MAIDCEGCKARDDQIKFLQELVKTFTDPLVLSKQTYTPKYINDMGEITDMKAQEEIELSVEVDDEKIQST